MKRKYCIICKKPKRLSRFRKNRISKNGYSDECKICRKKVNGSNKNTFGIIRRVKKYRKIPAELQRFGHSREEIYKEYGNECFACGKKKKLFIHHIDGKGGTLLAKQKNNKLSNLIPVCQSCHYKIHNWDKFQKNKKRRKGILYTKILFLRQKGFSFEKIGKVFSLSRQRIHQIYNNPNYKMYNIEHLKFQKLNKLGSNLKRN